MTADLERTLADAPALADVVARLRAAPARRVPDGFAARVTAAARAAEGEAVGRGVRTAVGVDGGAAWRRADWRAAAARWLPKLAVAAGAAAILAFGVTVGRRDGAAALAACQRADGTFSASSAAPYVQAYAVTVLAAEPAAHRAALAHAVAALVETQDAAGGWRNAGLSARNVAALAAAAKAGVASAGAAYRRGARYLRAQGIRELSAADLAREARDVAARVPRGDAGLARCIDLAARL